MKSIILILFLVSSSMAQCQNANIITETEYDNIKINNVKILTIKSTLGNKIAIENLFGTSINNNIDSDGNYFAFKGFEIGFSALLSSNYSQPILGGFDITSNNCSITIKGVTFTIGSNINLLGNVVFNTKTDNSKSILYMNCNGCNNYIAIDFNQSTNLITKIYYIELT